MMKTLIYATLILFIIGCNQNKLRQISDEELIEYIKNNNLPKPGDIQIYSADGNEISLDSLKTLELSGDYFEDFFSNDKNEVVRVVIRKKTEKDELLIKRINQAISK